MKSRSPIFERHSNRPEQPVLDTGYLQRLAGHVGITVLTELLADGLIELSDRLTRLGELTEAGDLDAVARIGHDLVGMAGHLGLSQLSAAAATMNRAVRNGPGAQANLTIKHVKSLGIVSVDAIRRYLNEAAPG